MKTVPLSIAATLTLMAAPLLQSAEAPKKPSKTATPTAKSATPVPKGVPVPALDLPPAKAAPLPETVAVVEGKEIKGAELEEAVASMLARQGAKPDDVPPDQRGRIYHMILDNMIMTKIVDKKSADFKVPEEEVTGEVDKIKAQLGSEAEMQKQLTLSGQTIDTVKGNIRDHLRQQHWVENQVKDGKKVTDADAEDYYKQNPDDFKKPEEVRASHILIAVPEDAKPEVVVQKEKIAQAALARVKGGEDFAKVAKELSDDPGSKENGGDLNFFTRDTKMVPEFLDAAFALKKDAVSEPVRSQFGYHIIKVTDRKDAESMTLESVKPKLIAYLQGQEQKKATTKMLQDLRAAADVKVTLPE